MAALRRVRQDRDVDCGAQSYRVATEARHFIQSRTRAVNIKGTGDQEYADMDRGWRVSIIGQDTATVHAGAFGQLDVFYEPGHGEWSFEVVGIRIAEVRAPRIEPRDSRGKFLITGQVDSAFPTMWPADHNEETDGPKVPYLWSLTVGGIQIDIAREDAPGIDIQPGVWLSVEVSGLTVWSAGD